MLKVSQKAKMLPNFRFFGNFEPHDDLARIPTIQAGLSNFVQLDVLLLAITLFQDQFFSSATKLVSSSRDLACSLEIASQNRKLLLELLLRRTPADSVSMCAKTVWN
jgi:hypothetical protein